MSQTIPPMMVATWPTHSGIDSWLRTRVGRTVCAHHLSTLVLRYLVVHVARRLHRLLLCTPPWYARRELSGPATAFERVLKGHRRRSQVCRGCG
jgi:hypothetical protein